MTLLFKNTIVFFVIVMNYSLEQIKQGNDYQVLYKAETRGSSVYMQYKDGNVILKSNTKNVSIELNRLQIKKIKNIISKINLSEITNLEAPTNNRFSDGTLIANLIITKGKTQYISSNFDHENPPKELGNLYFELKGLINKKG